MRFKRRYILTGSPAPNGLQDLYGQIYLLDFGRALGSYVTHFRHRYMFPVQMGKFKKWFLKTGATVEINKVVSHLVTRLDAKDYLEMPSRIDRVVHVKLPTKAQHQYEEMKRDFVLELEEGDVTAVNAAVKTSKLRQMANGFLYLDREFIPGMETTKKVAASIHPAKLDALDDLIEELSGQPALVVYEFIADFDGINARLSKKLGLPTIPNIGGGVPTNVARRRMEAWNHGDLPVLAVHPASAGHGLNLQQGGRHVVWFGIPWNLEHYDQTIRRVWRQGQKNRVFVHHIVAKGTIDEVVMQVLRTKARTQGGLLDALRKRWTR